MCVFCQINQLVQELLGEKMLRTADLISTGKLDSLALVNLILELESRFSITFDYDSLDLISFRSINSISTTVTQIKQQTNCT